jgi:DNA polymerase-3 subunit alpha
MGTGKSFAHLHVHTDYSMLDGAAKHKPLVEEAARLGMPAVAMTDHGNPFGAYEFRTAAQAAGVTPILGMEAYVAPESRHHKEPVFWGTKSQRKTDETTGAGGDVSGTGAYTHMTLLAQNATGLRNLFEVSSLANTQGLYRKPRVDAELLAEHAEGLIGTTGCPGGEIQTRIRLGQFGEALKAAAKYRDIFGSDSYFLELMDHGLPIERRVRADLLRLGKELGIPPLATNDSHYVTQDQAAAHDILLCVGTQALQSDVDRFKFANDSFYLRSAKEMRDLWDDQVPGATDNTLLIAERVAPDAYDEVFAHRQLMPEFDVPEGETQASWLRKETARGVRRRFGAHPSQEVLDRVEFELGVIESMGFPAYFLVVADICAYARENDIWVGPGRGSATGSMVSYVIGITELDPIEYGLIFERFLNPERVSMPDIDLDFDERYRDQMVRYVTEKYGAANVSQIITFGKIKARAAIKDAARVLGFPYAVGERLSKAMPPDRFGATAPLDALTDENSDWYAEAGGVRDMIGADADARTVFDTARGIEGLTRGTGVHSAGVILSAKPLIKILPLQMRESDGAIIAGFPFQHAEAMGLLKMDFLGLRNGAIIKLAIAAIKAAYGTEISLTELPLDDKKTYELLQRGDTLGVFQLDSAPVQSLLRAMVPTEFKDLAAVLALYRPGPMDAKTHTNYAARKNGRQPITSIHPELTEALETILAETYGLVVYQEQVMAIAQKLAGYTLANADLLRRAMGKKKKAELDAQWENFSGGMAKNGYSASAAKAIWDVLMPFSQYGFNKSHTAGYGMVAYQTAYLKANYPAEYMAALLTSVRDDKDKMVLYLGECRRMGLKVLPPDVNASGTDFAAIDGEVRFGLSAVRNVGPAVVEGIVAARQPDPYADFTDFMVKVPPGTCSKKGLESLAKAGAFDGLGHSRHGLLMAIPDAVKMHTGLKRNEAQGQDSLFGELDGGDVTTRVEISDHEWDKATLLTFEREMLGLYVSSHPLDGADHILERSRDLTIVELLTGPSDGATVTIAGIVTSYEHKVSKKGSRYARATVEDLTGSVEVMLFSKAYALYGSMLADQAAVAVTARVSLNDDGFSLFVDAITPLDISEADEDVPLVISASEDQITPAVVAELNRALQAHPGSTPVQMCVTTRRRTKRTYGLPAQVSPNGGLTSDLKTLLGPACVSALGSRTTHHPRDGGA